MQADKVIRQWDVVTGKQAGPSMTFGNRSVTAMALSSDGQFLVIAEDGGVLQVSSTRDGSPLSNVMLAADADIDWTKRRVSSVAFSPDGRLIVSGALGDDSVRLWDSITREQVARMIGHTQDVTSVAFSPDSRYVLSGANDSTVRVWDVLSHNPVGAPLKVGDRDVVHVAVSPDRQLIVAGLADGTVRTWAGPEAWSRALCAKLTQNMSGADWAHRVGPGFPHQQPCEGLPEAE
jgi:WD40 repeat protein